MDDTDTWAHRTVAGYDVYLRRETAAGRWEISQCDKILNPATAILEGTFRWAEFASHSIVKQTFATPEEAAEKLRPILAQPPATAG